MYSSVSPWDQALTMLEQLAHSPSRDQDGNQHLDSALDMLGQSDDMNGIFGVRPVSVNSKNTEIATGECHDLDNRFSVSGESPELAQDQKIEAEKQTPPGWDNGEQRMHLSVSSWDQALTMLERLASMESTSEPVESTSGPA